MKPVLVIGLGNPLMGDDGVGWYVADRLARRPDLPPEVDVVCGGTDLLRFAPDMEGRRSVIVIDAALDDAEQGSVCAIDPDEALCSQEHAHHLSAAEAIRLLKLTVPAEFRLFGISVHSAGFGAALSPALAAKLPAILEEILALVNLARDSGGVGTG